VTPSDKLMGRLRDMGMSVPDGSTLHRTHAGQLQRRTGAWSWSILDPAGRELCGSYSPVTELLRGPLTVLDSEYGVPEVVPAAEAGDRTKYRAGRTLFSEPFLTN